MTINLIFKTDKEPGSDARLYLMGGTLGGRSRRIGAQGQLGLHSESCLRGGGGGRKYKESEMILLKRMNVIVQQINERCSA